MGKFHQGQFEPTNPEKYLGKGKIIYRSSWELTMMKYLDTHPDVKGWASEAIAIKYMNPFTKKISNYIPDFFIQYVDKNGNDHAELVEVKPASQATMEAAGRSKRNQAMVILNSAKWAAAIAYCNKAKIKFRIVTESDIYHVGKKK